MGCTVHGIAKSQTELSDLRFHFQGRWKIPHAAKLVQLNKLKKKKKGFTLLLTAFPGPLLFSNLSIW